MICIARARKQRWQRVHSTETQPSNICAYVVNKEMCAHSTLPEGECEANTVVSTGPRIRKRHERWTRLGGLI